MITNISKKQRKSLKNLYSNKKIGLIKIIGILDERFKMTTIYENWIRSLFMMGIYL